MQVARLGGEDLGTGPVAVRDPLRGALPGVRPDSGGRLDLDQLLQRPLGEFTDQVGALPDAQRVEQLRNGRLFKSHRRVLLRCALGRTHQGSRRWLTPRWTRFPPRQGTHTPDASCGRRDDARQYSRMRRAGGPNLGTKAPGAAWAGPALSSASGR